MIQNAKETAPGKTEKERRPERDKMVKEDPYEELRKRKSPPVIQK